MIVSEALKEYLDALPTMGVSVATQDTYSSYIKHFVLFVGDGGELVALKPAVVRRFLTHLEAENQSTSSRMIALCAVKHFSKWLVAEGYLLDGFCANVKTASVVNTPKSPLSDAELEAMFAACLRLKSEARCVQAQALLTLAAYCGLRVGSLCAVQVSDVNFINKTLYVRPIKRGAGVTRTVPGEILEPLRRLHELRPEGLSYDEFFWRTQGFPYTSQSVRNLFREIGRVAGIADYKERALPHNMRHTCLTRVYRATKDINAARTVAGHKSIAHTTRYVHADEQAYADGIAASLGKPLPEPTPDLSSGTERRPVRSATWRNRTLSRS